MNRSMTKRWMLGSLVIVSGVMLFTPPGRGATRDDVRVLDTGGRFYSDVSPAAEGTLYYVDFRTETLGRFHIDQADAPNVLLEQLRCPLSLVVRGSDVYFSEGGTKEEKYRDGRVSVYHVDTGQVEVLASRLNYPDSIFLTDDETLYILESGGSSTSFRGGRNRISKLAKGASEPTVALDRLCRPTAIVVDPEGDIFVGCWGESSPGDDARLLRYRVGERKPEVVATDLPKVSDLAIDSSGNLYLSGSGLDQGERRALGILRKGRTRIEWVDKGVHVFGMGLGEDGTIYLTTGRGAHTVRILNPQPY